MNLGTIIFGLVATAFCVLPFVLMSRNRKKKETELVDGLMTLAVSLGSTVAEYDCGIDFAIGVSEERDYLFFWKKKGQVADGQLVRLSTVADCTVRSQRHTVQNQNITSAVIDRLELVFEYKDKKVAPERLVFFDHHERLQLTGELQLVEKWEKIVSSYLTKD
ncbi:hypothetical protein LAG90_17875 [Marinilongibacter aquaticus]|uniref:hypothetical protein n=1 Tax=Marinilongibacter aquaticus TaxID=2975157 RepID=UPI0021BDB490|nr:hypothetical protein [Marinilongibacter aquaticus]UBM58672.1 hypothetical protein LAG90_17875 [Marinilongibacter aquaticus]